MAGRPRSNTYSDTTLLAQNSQFFSEFEGKIPAGGFSNKIFRQAKI